MPDRTMTVNIDHTASLDKRYIAVQGEQITVDVVLAAGLWALGYDGYVDFIMPDGSTCFKGPYDCSTGTISFTLGAVDSVLDKDGMIWWQFVLAETVGSVRTTMWLSEQVESKVLPSILATTSAILPYVPQMVFPVSYPASNVSLADVPGRFFSLELESALMELAGSGRTTQTVKGNNNDLEQRAINVKRYGVVGDGVTDDTTAIQTILDSASTQKTSVYFPEGTYMIDAETSIIPGSNTTILLSPHATLKAITNDAGSYSIILLDTVDNVIIQGGIVQGERTTHTGVTGEWGMCIRCIGCTNVTLQDVICKDGWGDGIYVGKAADGTHCNNIKIVNCTCDNNRRNGCSVVDCNYGYAIGCDFINTNGTAPQAGIDLEANADTIVEDFRIIACYSYNNTGDGIDVYGDNTKKSSLIGNVCKGNAIGIVISSTEKNIVSGNRCSENTSDGIKLSTGGSANYCRYNQINDNTVDTNGGHGIYLNGASANFVERNIISHNTINNNTGSGILVGHSRKNIIGENIVFTNNYGIITDGATAVRNIITNNYVSYSATAGIRIASNFNLVSNNSSKSNQEEGLLIINANNNIASNNYIETNSQKTDEGYCNIDIQGSSVYNNVQGNLCRQGAGTNKPSYGIRVKDATCTSNFVTNNDLYDSGKTGTLLDGGTTTVTTAGNRT